MHLNSVFFIDDDEVANICNKQVARDYKLAETLHFFTSAQKAILALEKLDKLNFPALIFIDIYMPQMDGYELLDSIRSMPGYDASHTCFIFLTGSLFMKDTIRANKAMVDHYHWKPLTDKTLDEILRQRMIRKVKRKDG